MFVKAYGFLSFAKIMVKNIGKIYVNNGLSGKYSQKRFDHAKQSATYAIETSFILMQLKRVIRKTAQATGDLIDNKIATKITNLSKNSQQNDSETVTNEHDNEIPKERYVSAEERQEIID